MYVIEVNPRASRTVPFISKSTGIPLAKIATKVMLGIKLKKFNLHNKKLDYVTVKESVFPFDRFPGEDIILGPGVIIVQHKACDTPPRRHGKTTHCGGCGVSTTVKRYVNRLCARH